MHTDLQQFGTTFSVQSVLPKLRVLRGAFTASVADEVTQARALDDTQSIRRLLVDKPIITVGSIWTSVRSSSITSQILSWWWKRGLLLLHE